MGDTRTLSRRDNVDNLSWGSVASLLLLVLFYVHKFMFSLITIFRYIANQNLGKMYIS